MGFVIADEHKKEIGYLSGHAGLDMEIGKQNDFETIIGKETAHALGLGYGRFLFMVDSEFGGMFTGSESWTDSAEMKWRGITWRGLLERDVIIPPPAQDYRIVSGEANDILRLILAENSAAGSLFTVPNISTGVIFPEYRFGRYVTKLDGLSKMLFSQGLKLLFRAVYGAPGAPFEVRVTAVPIQDYSETLEYSQDSRVNIEIVSRRGGINHLICLGKGELRDQQRIDLYVQADGSIGDAKHYTGAAERIAVYSNDSAENLSNLREGGTDELRKSMDAVSLSMKVKSFDVEIGDIVGGRDRNTGITLKQPVTGKILRVQNNQESIEISVGGGAEDDQGNGEA